VAEGGGLLNRYTGYTVSQVRILSPPPPSFLRVRCRFQEDGEAAADAELDLAAERKRTDLDALDDRAERFCGLLARAGLGGQCFP
jgi:hypothetical protein